MDKFTEQYNDMLDYGVCSEETLRVVVAINGNTVETLNDVLYVVTGYRNWDQFYDGEIQALTEE